MTRLECLKILDLSITASPDEIVAAYRQLAQVWHPDRFSNNTELQKRAHAKLAEINSAYHALRDQKFTREPKSKKTKPLDEWFYSIVGKKNGPIKAADLIQLAASGILKPDDLVWRSGMPEWVPARQIKALREVFFPEQTPGAVIEISINPAPIFRPSKRTQWPLYLMGTFAIIAMGTIFSLGSASRPSTKGSPIEVASKPLSRPHASPKSIPRNPQIEEEPVLPVKVASDVSVPILPSQSSKPSPPKTSGQVDGRNLFSIASNKANAQQNANQLLPTILDGFPASVMVASVIGEPKVLDQNAKTALIAVDVSISVDLEKYDQIQAKVTEVLATVAASHGRYELNLVEMPIPTRETSDDNLRDRDPATNPYGLKNGTCDHSWVDNGRSDVTTWRNGTYHPLQNSNQDIRAAITPISNLDEGVKMMIVVNMRRDPNHGPNSWQWFQLMRPINIRHSAILAISLIDEHGAEIENSKITLNRCPGTAWVFPSQVAISPYWISSRTLSESLRIRQKLSLDISDLKRISKIVCEITRTPEPVVKSRDNDDELDLNPQNSPKVELTVQQIKTYLEHAKSIKAEKIKVLETLVAKLNVEIAKETGTKQLLFRKDLAESKKSLAKALKENAYPLLRSNFQVGDIGSLQAFHAESTYTNRTFVASHNTENGRYFVVNEVPSNSLQHFQSIPETMVFRVSSVTGRSMDVASLEIITESQLELYREKYSK